MVDENTKRTNKNFCGGEKVMFPDIDSFNMFFFPALALIVAAMWKEEDIIKFMSRKRGKSNGIKHN